MAVAQREELNSYWLPRGSTAGSREALQRVMLRLEQGTPRQGWLIEEEEGGGCWRGRGLCMLLGRYPKAGLGGSGVGMGAGNPVAGSLAGLAWFTWIVRQTKPSS